MTAAPDPVRPEPPAQRRVPRLVAAVQAHPNVAAVLVVLAVTLVVTWRQLTQGGLFLDDWWLAAEARYGGGSERQSYFGLFDGIWAITGYRPASVPFFAVLVEVAELNPHIWAAVPVLLTAILGLVAYGTLRAARAEWLVAVGVAVVVVVLPFSAVTKYWACGSQLTLSMILVLAGLWVSGRSLRGAGGRVGMVVSALLLAAGALTYEVVVGLIPLGLLYYASATQGRWRRSAVRMVADCVIVTVALVIGRLGARTDAQPVDVWDDHARTFVREAWWLGSGGIVPDGAWGIAFQLVVAAGVVWLLVRIALDRQEVLAAARTAVRGPLASYAVLMVAGVVAVLAGYALLVPADAWYHPTQPGQGGRVNTVASLGYALGYTGFLLAVATILCLGLGKRLAWMRGVLAAVLFLLLAGSFAGQSRVQEDRYVAGWKLAKSLTDNLKATFPQGPPADTTILTFGEPGYVVQNIPTLGETWDLNGAVRLIFADGSLHGFPILEGQAVDCRADGVVLPLNASRPPLYGENYKAPYTGSVAFADPAKRRAVFVTSQRSCRKALQTMVPGPYYAPAAQASQLAQATTSG